MKKILFSVTAAFAAATAMGQLSHINTTTEGTGSLSYGGRNYSIERASVVMRGDGRAEVALYSSREGSWRFTGTYRSRGSYDATFSFTDGSDDSRGSGNAQFGDRDVLVSLDGNGSSRRGAFRFNFTAENRGGGTGSGNDRPGSEQIRGTYNVNGLLTIGDKVTRIDRAAITTGNNGKFSVRLTGSGRTFSYEGEYFARRGNKVDFHLDSGSNSRTNARGEMFFNGNNLESMNFDGRDSAGQLIFSAKLDELTKPGDTWNSGFEMNVALNGDGRSDYNGSRDNLNRGYVELKSNGDAEIKVFGRRELAFTGRWRKLGSDRYAIEIEEGLGSNNTSGSGTVWGSRGRFTRIQLSGRDGSRRSYSLDFSVNGGGGGSVDLNDDELWSSSDRTSRGRGDVRMFPNELRDTIDSVRLRMDSNGRFTLELDGDKVWRFEGTWTRDNKNKATLRINSSNLNRDTVGSGSVQFDRSNFKRVDLKFTLADKGYTSKFDVR